MTTFRTLWDISPPVSAGSPVFPGDTPYARRWVATLDAACPVNVSAVTLSPHVGAHADAPLHYDPNGAAVGELALAPFIGRCRVIHAIGVAPLVGWRHLAHALPPHPRDGGVGPGEVVAGTSSLDSGPVVDLPRRVLVRCYAQAPSQAFDAALPAFEPALVEALADLGVLLLGCDSASVDPADSKALPSHQVLRRRGLRVLENLCLDDVPEGDYELIALPLRWMDADASPVRAVLRPWPPDATR
ncbi:MAG: Kynurenine formamidase [Pseudomonadota bacterium]|jgi:arylformamidase